MVEKLIPICKDIDWDLDSKDKMWLPSYCLSICNFFHIHHYNLSVLTVTFGVFNNKSLCSAKFTVDVTPFFAIYYFDFYVGSRGLQSII